MSHLRLPTLDLPPRLLARLHRLTEVSGSPGVMYTRISEDREGAGLGVERQLEDQCALFGQLGLRLTGVYADNDLSAFTGKPRPDYLAMLADLDAGRARVVTAWHTDRLHRTPRELETYIDLAERRGVVTHSVKAGPLDLATPSGRAVARTLCAWARFESEHKGERVRAARRQAAEQGRWQGGCRPFGFEPDGTTLRPAEAAAIAQASEAIVAGASLRSVVRDLNESGHRTAWDRQWTTVGTRDMLRRPRNAGLTSYGAETFPAVWPAIVPEVTWRAVVSILSNPARRTTTSNRVKWLGSGLYVCGVCGQPALRVSHSGTRQPAYRCKARDNTRQSGHVIRVAQRLDEYVERIIVARLQRPDATSLFTASTDTNFDATALHTEAAAISQRLTDLSTAFAEGAITLAQLRTGTDKLRTRMTEINDTLTAAAKVNPLIGLAGQPNIAQIWYGTSADRCGGLDLGRRRAVLATLLTVTVLPTSKGRRPDGSYFDPTSIHIEWKTH
ncbi:MAG TPA: recombinase family protein [Pseudonocardiaceae bacterium]|nr:recombinase family protein [Pseudonocardiaceae bacterium]